MVNEHIAHLERMNYGHIKLYAGSASLDLATEIASILGIPLCERDVVIFPNDNIFVRLHTSVRGQDCYVIQTTAAPVQQNLMELLILIRTLRQDSAARITAVVPYMCYSRSDKKDQPRVAITARLVADLIEMAGADRYIVYDLHSKQIQGFFSIPGDVMTAFYTLSDYLKGICSRMQSPVIVATDLGFSKNARSYGMALNAPLAFIEKRRIYDTNTQALTLIGDVKNRDAIIVDDEVDTGGSICEAVNLVKEKGARNVYVVFVHPVLSLDASERLAGLPVTEFITTNTIPIPPEKLALFGSRLHILSIAPLLSEVITRANEGRSVGELFNE